MSIRELNLTKEQHDWLNGWLELWGAWCNAANNFGLIHNQFRIAILAILDPELSAFFAKH